MGATALACLLSGLAPATPAFAQSTDLLAQEAPSDAQMLLEADTLIYDNDNETVIAEGSVQIDYGGNRLVAQRVVYNRKTGRLVASGNVEIVENTGNRIFSDEIDITDDFRDGFLNALRVETPEKTYFAAESADRKGGDVTTFNNGVYTACEPCEDKPDKAPIWRIKARKIIWDGKAKTVRFENSRFELFGMPIAYLPVIVTPDPTVKRKTGFLFPGFGYKSELGAGFAVPFYVALSDTYDLTLQGSYYTKQGFLGEAEWRQRFNNGYYNLKLAGIVQKSPGSFDANTVSAGTLADPNRKRGMVASKGVFTINPRWTFGWDVMVQSDKSFSKTYTIGGYSGDVHRSEVYLTGLNDRNYFDMRFQRFQVQEEVFNSAPTARYDKQPWVLPTFDYAYTPDTPVAGGELNIDVNARVLHRTKLDEVQTVPVVRGVAGTTSRLTVEAEWKRTMITDGGLVVTPLLHVRGDTAYSNITDSSVTAINQMAVTEGVAADVRAAYNRYMATAGLELRWPLLFSTTSSTHVLEPMVQAFARPNEQFVNGLGIPNEDAQSFVFDASSLFERDKFSGYDRMEGGSRVNVGFRYSGSFASGWTTNAIVGQSYHVAGRNSFAAPDLVNVGAFSGLETPRSDFVGLAGFTSPFGLSASASVRLDEQSLAVRRAELKAGASIRSVSLTGKYAYIQAQPLYGFPTDRHEVTVGASARVAEFWRVFGSGTYDFQSNVLVSDSIGFAYDDECFSYSMTFSESRDRITRKVTQNIGFYLSFRTIGDFGSDSGTLGSIQ